MGNEMSLWKDMVEKSPVKARGYNNLGGVYEDQGLPDRTLELYRIA